MLEDLVAILRDLEAMTDRQTVVLRELRALLVDLADLVRREVDGRDLPS